MEDLVLKLSAKEVNSKVFEGKNGGYDALQVDKYLDLVVNDYVAFEKFYLNARKLKEDYDGLVKTLENYKTRLADVEYKKTVLDEKLQVINDNGGGESNIELLQRIAKLESALYRLGKDPSKIK